MKKVHLRLICFAQKRVCLSSLQKPFFHTVGKCCWYLLNGSVELCQFVSHQDCQVDCTCLISLILDCYGANEAARVLGNGEP